MAMTALICLVASYLIAGALLTRWALVSDGAWEDAEEEGGEARPEPPHAAAVVVSVAAWPVVAVAIGFAIVAMHVADWRRARRRPRPAGSERWHLGPHRWDGRWFELRQVRWCTRCGKRQVLVRGRWWAVMPRGTPLPADPPPQEVIDSGRLHDWMRWRRER